MPVLTGKLDTSVNGPEGLPPFDGDAWERTDWRHHEEQVRRLRSRIFKAARDGDWPLARNLQKLTAPRGALSYPRFSREELEGRFLGLMAYLDPKGEGDNSMPGNQRSCPGVWGEVLGDPRDMAKAGLPESQSPGDVSPSSAGKTPGTGAVSCVGIVRWPAHPSGCGAIPS